MEAVNGVAEGPPPPSPLTGCYLLVVLGEPHTGSHKDIILQRLAKGLLSWNVNDCLVDLERELSIVTEQGLEGEEARYGERLIQYASENLVTEILIHPSVSTLAQCVRNLLSSFTRHRHIIHAGYTFAGNGSWILQDGTFSLADFSEAFQEIDVQRVIHAYENGISIDIHCSSEGEWTRLPKDSFTKGCKVRINPDDVLGSGLPAITNFVNYIAPFLVPAELDNTLESSDVVGNIRFSRPTLYVFPGGQGDAALFGINGFNMLVDGGFSRKACFWDFVRHLDRLDAVILTRLNNSNANGIGAVLRRKAQNAVYPQIGHFFCNIQSRKANLSPDGDKDSDPLLVNLLEEGHELISNLRSLDLSPQLCYRDSEPINLYHKVGHGTLDMYVLNPAKDSREVKEFLLRWNNNDHKLFANHKFSREYMLPLQNIVSICALLVWRPANPNDTITRILFPGSAPQGKVIEGLDKLKNLECIKHTICTEKMLAPPPKLKSKENILDKIVAPEKPKIDTKKNKPKPTAENKILENNMKNGLQNGHTEKQVTKAGSVESDKSDTKSTKPKRDDAKIIDNKQEKISARPKADVNSAKLRQKPSDKKASPPTPKKVIDTKKSELDRDISNQKTRSKTSPSATPAKSTKDANNRKVLESKTKSTAKKEIKETKQPDKKEEIKKVERKPISRRPKNEMKLPQSPVKRIVNGVHKPDSLSKKNKLDKDGTTDSSTVSTPSVDQDSLMKKDISKLTPEEVQQLKAQELAELKEEQEAIKELEAVFRKGNKATAESSDLRKIKDISIEDKTEPEEYLIVEKEITEPIQSETEVEVKEEETVKLARDSEESEKKKDRDDEKEDRDKQVDTEQEESGIGEQETDVEDGEEIRENEISKEPSMLSPEENKRMASKEELAQESQPEEKISANIESGATTTAPTLPEDERIPLNDIKEDTPEQIEEKHVREETREKDTKDELPVVIPASKPIENLGKIPSVVGIRLDKESRIRDIVKTPDEVADLPVHEEADVDHLDEFVHERPEKSKLKDTSHDINGLTPTLTKEGEKIENLHKQISEKGDILNENQPVPKHKLDEGDTTIQPTQKEEVITEDAKKHMIEMKDEKVTKIVSTAPITEIKISEQKGDISKSMPLQDYVTEKATNFENMIHKKEDIPKEFQTVVDGTTEELSKDMQNATHTNAVEGGFDEKFTIDKESEEFAKKEQSILSEEKIKSEEDEKVTSKAVVELEEPLTKKEGIVGSGVQHLKPKDSEIIALSATHEEDRQPVEKHDEPISKITPNEQKSSIEKIMKEVESVENGKIDSIIPEKIETATEVHVTSATDIKAPKSEIKEITLEKDDKKDTDGLFGDVVEEKDLKTSTPKEEESTSTQQLTDVQDVKESMSNKEGDVLETMAKMEIYSREEPITPKDEDRKDEPTKKIINEEKKIQSVLDTDIKVKTFKKDEEIDPKTTLDKDLKEIKSGTEENKSEVLTKTIETEDQEEEFIKTSDVKNLEKEIISSRQELVQEDGVKVEVPSEKSKVAETIETKSDNKESRDIESEIIKISKDGVEAQMEDDSEMLKYRKETLDGRNSMETEGKTLLISETSGSELEKDLTAMITEDHSQVVEKEKNLIEDSVKKDSVVVEPIQRQAEEIKIKGESHPEKKPEESILTGDESLSRSIFTELPTQQEIKIPARREDGGDHEIKEKQTFKSEEIGESKIAPEVEESPSPSSEQSMAKIKREEIKTPKSEEKEKEKTISSIDELEKEKSMLHHERKDESEEIVKGHERKDSTPLSPKQSAIQDIKPPTVEDNITISPQDELEKKKKESSEISHEHLVTKMWPKPEESREITEPDEKEKSPSPPSEQSVKQVIRTATFEDKKTIPLTHDFEIEKKDSAETTHERMDSRLHHEREESLKITKSEENEKSPSPPSEKSDKAIEPKEKLVDDKSIPPTDDHETTHEIIASKSGPEQNESQEETKGDEKDPSLEQATEPLTSEDKKTIQPTDTSEMKKKDSPEATPEIVHSRLHLEQGESQEITKREEKEKSQMPLSEQSTKQAIEPPTSDDNKTIPLTDDFEMKKKDSHETTHEIIESKPVPDQVESQEITAREKKEKSPFSFSEQSAKQEIEPPSEDKKIISLTDISEMKKKDSPEPTSDLVESRLHPEQGEPQDITKLDEKQRSPSPSSEQSAKQAVEPPTSEDKKTIPQTDVDRKKESSPETAHEIIATEQSAKHIIELPISYDKQTISLSDEVEMKEKDSSEIGHGIIESKLDPEEGKIREVVKPNELEKSSSPELSTKQETKPTISGENELDNKKEDTSKIDLEIIKLKVDHEGEISHDHFKSDKRGESPTSEVLDDAKITPITDEPKKKDSTMDDKDKSASPSRELPTKQELKQEITPNKDESESRVKTIEDKPHEHAKQDTPKKEIEAAVSEMDKHEKSIPATDALERKEKYDEQEKSQSPDFLTKQEPCPKIETLIYDDQKEDKIIPMTDKLEKDTCETSLKLSESILDPEDKKPEQLAKTDDKEKTPLAASEMTFKQEQKQEMETSILKTRKDVKAISSPSEIEKEKQDNSEISSEIIESREVPEERNLQKHSKLDEKEKPSSPLTEQPFKQEIEGKTSTVGLVGGEKDHSKTEMIESRVFLKEEEPRERSQSPSELHIKQEQKQNVKSLDEIGEGFTLERKDSPEIIKSQPEEDTYIEQPKREEKGQTQTMTEDIESKDLKIITSTDIEKSAREHVTSEGGKTSFVSNETVTETAQEKMLVESGDEKSVGLPHENIEDVSNAKIDGESDIKTAEGQSKQEVTEEPFLPFLSKRASLLEGAEIPTQSSEKEDKIDSKDINLNQEYPPVKPKDISEVDEKKCEPTMEKKEDNGKDMEVSSTNRTEISEILGNLIKDADPDSVLDESQNDGESVKFSKKGSKSEILEEMKDHTPTEKLSCKKEYLPENAEKSIIQDQAELKIQKTDKKEDESLPVEDIHLHDIHNFLEQERSHTHKEMGSSVTDKKVEDVEKPIKEKPLDELQSKLDETCIKQVQELKEDKHEEKNITETSSTDTNKIGIGKDTGIKPDTDHDNKLKLEEDSNDEDSMDDEVEHILEKGMVEAKEKVESIEHDSGKAECESEKPYIKTEKIKIDLTDKREHAEAVLLKSTPESPVVNIVPSLPALPTDIDKTELGRKSPKEREEDVAKIVVSVATVLKSDAPLEEFHGKIPLTTNTPYGGYTTELRETHITTCDSPIDETAVLHEEPHQPATEKKIESSQFIDEQSSITTVDKDEEKSDDHGLDKNDESEDPGTVHRMLVTASSEDGGEEIEICPAGTITFCKSSESSGRSSPENMSRKPSQSSSALDTISDHTTVKELMETQTKKEPIEEQISKTSIEGLQSIEKSREDPLGPKLYPDIDLKREVESLEDQIECQEGTVKKEDEPKEVNLVSSDTSKGATQDNEEIQQTISGKVYSIFGNIFSSANKIEEAISHTLTETIHSAESTIDEGFKKVENEIEEVKHKITKIESDTVESLSEKKEKAEHIIADRLKESASSLEKVLDQTDKDKNSLIQDAQSTLGRISAPLKETVGDLLSDIADSIKDKDDSVITGGNDTSQKIEKSGEFMKDEIHESEEKTILTGKSHTKESATSEEEFIAKSSDNLYPSLKDELKGEEKESDISTSSKISAVNLSDSFTEEKKVPSHETEIKETTSIIQNGFDHEDNIVDKIAKDTAVLTEISTKDEKLKDGTIISSLISSVITDVPESKCDLDKETGTTHKSSTDEISTVKESDVLEDTSRVKDSKIASPIDIENEPSTDKDDIHATSKLHHQISPTPQHEIDSVSCSATTTKDAEKELSNVVVDDSKEKDVSSVDDTKVVDTKITSELVDKKDSVGSAIHQSIEQLESVEKVVTSLTQDSSSDLKEVTDSSKENLESSPLSFGDKTGESTESVLSDITSTLGKGLLLGFSQQEEEPKNLEGQKDDKVVESAADKKIAVEISEKSDTTKQDTSSVITDISTIVKEEIESSFKDLIGVEKDTTRCISKESDNITDSLASVKSTALEAGHALKEDTEKALGEVSAKSVQLLMQEKENVLQKSSEFQTEIEGTKKAINEKIEDITKDIKDTKENLGCTLINTKENIESSLGEVVQDIEKEKEALKLAGREMQSDLKHAVDDVLSTGKQLFSGLFGSKKEESSEEKEKPSVVKKEEKLDTDKKEKTNDDNEQNKIYTEKSDICPLPKIEARESDEAKQEKYETDTNLEISHTGDVPVSCDIRKNEFKSCLDVEPCHEKKLSISDVEIIVGEKLKDSSASKHDSVTTEHVFKPDEISEKPIEIPHITQLREETAAADDLKGKIQDIAIGEPLIAEKHITDVPSTESSSKDDARSITLVSDDHKEEKQSAQSLSQVQKSPTQIECEKTVDSDDDSLGSPRSISSQIPQSRNIDPMSMSFYGALPDEKDILDNDEHISEDVDYESSLSFVHLHDITKAKFDGKIVQGSEIDDEAAADTCKLPPQDPMTSSFYGELPGGKDDEDPIGSWGKPLGLPSPAPPNERGTPKKERRLPSNVMAKNRINDDFGRSESPSKNKKKINPVYVDLTYVPHHGNSNYAYVDFFKKVRARYYVFSGIEPSREVYNALLEAKQTWEDKELEVTIIPTYDTDVLGYWVAENEELLAKYKIDLSPSASRCTINLQDHETSCSAYRLEF